MAAASLSVCIIANTIVRETLALLDWRMHLSLALAVSLFLGMFLLFCLDGFRRTFMLYIFAQIGLFLVIVIAGLVNQFRHDPVLQCIRWEEHTRE
jgi:hypothetical protein